MNAPPVARPVDGALEERIDRAVADLDLAAKVRLLTGASMWRTHAEPAVGLGALVMSDGPVGVRGESWDERDPSVTAPSPTALGATWDPDLVREVAAVLAAECRRKGVDVLLAPTINLHRSPLGGRHFEAYSEDPVLTGVLGTAFVRGVQDAGVAATAKHYVANDSETERFTLDARLDERTLHELYLAPFEHLVREGGAWVVMSAYSGVNGSPMTCSPLLAEPLKGSWGFDGLVVSDWTAVRTTEESARAAQDLVMPGPDAVWGDRLVAAVEAGRVPEEAVDDKVRRLLRLAARVGRWGGAVPDRPVPDRPAPPPDRAAAVLRRAAAAGAVLLRNEGGALPLPAVRRLAVLGPGAAEARVLGGGSAEVNPHYVVSPLEGLRAALGPDVDVVHAAGVAGRGPAALVAGDVVEPDAGGPGLRVRFLDAQGRVVDSQRRLSGRLVWAPDEVPPHATTIEVAARLRADVAGTWRVGVAGTGRYAMAVGGRTVYDGVLAVETDDEPATALAPPWWTVPVEFARGERVDLLVRHEVGTAAYGASVTLGAVRPARDDAEELAAAVAAAAAADAAVVVVGTTGEIESEGFDRASLALPAGQDELVSAVARANPRTVVVVNSGGPVAMPWFSDVPAVLLSWFPGQEGGNAIADVLLGRVEPGGRLPTTWAVHEADVPVLDTRPAAGRLEYAEGLHVGYRAWLRSGRAPAGWFGAGLGYTTWEFLGAALPAALGPDEPLRVRVALRNTGSRPGGEVVQVYLSRPGSAVERPARWLAGFARVEADPGADVEVDVVVPHRAVEHWDGGWRTEPGPVAVHVGRSAVDTPLGGSVVVR